MSATQSEIEEALTCQCGCGLTVHNCNHLQCPSGIPLKAEIAAQLSLGKTRPEILQYFSGKYGEKILSSPTTTGFNLLAWVMPFAVVLVAAFVILRIVARWRRAPAATTAAAPAAPAPRGAPGETESDAARRARLAAELGRYDG